MTDVSTQSDLERGVALAARARKWGAWYVAEHRFRVMRSYLQTVLLTGIGNPLVYLFALGVGLASLVDANLGPDAVGGVGYLVFVAPALLCSAAITVATEEFTYPIMLGYKWNPVFFGMNASPLRPGQIVDGIVISVVVRMLLTCALYFVFMLLFGAVPNPAGWVAVFVAVLTGVAFGAVIMGYTSTLTEDTGQLAMVMRFVVLPMTLFSGTFFPTHGSCRCSCSGSAGSRRSGMAPSSPGCSVTATRNPSGSPSSTSSTSSCCSRWAGPGRAASP